MASKDNLLYFIPCAMKRNKSDPLRRMKSMKTKKNLRKKKMPQPMYSSEVQFRIKALLALNKSIRSSCGFKIYNKKGILLKHSNLQKINKTMSESLSNYTKYQDRRRSCQKRPLRFMTRRPSKLPEAELTSHGPGSAPSVAAPGDKG